MAGGKMSDRQRLAIAWLIIFIAAALAILLATHPQAAPAGAARSGEPLRPRDAECMNDPLGRHEGRDALEAACAVTSPAN